ncbi:hypothetical protein QWY90_00025 [Flavobacterium paronense]|uniref:hypothetical protein n=1 Tax=Flavobacterium paronense TaxID=1392775 RepID=UPI0025B419A9|nr:hypothetical protein [Flavobacterium paronense]MDN3675758.1 hypothetical protein [Flavobacterium paronense]
MCQVGFGFRADATKNTELSHTVGRYTTLQTLKLGDIDQTNIFSYINVEYTFWEIKDKSIQLFDLIISSSITKINWHQLL